MSMETRRDFIGTLAAGGALIATAALPTVAQEKRPTKRNRTMPILSYAHFDIGVEKPFSVLHISDTHLTSTYPGETPRQIKSAADRTRTFGGRQKEALEVSVEWAKKASDYLLHTGDVIDFQTDANLDIVKRLFGSDQKVFGAVGNHEYYLEKDNEPPSGTEAYKELSRDMLSNVFANDVAFASTIVHGINFITMDNVYGTVTARQAEQFEREAKKGMPIVLCVHVPFFTDSLWRMSERYWRDRGKKFVEAGVPAPRTDRLRQIEDSTTRDFIAYMKSERRLRGILAGHLHVAMEDRFSPTAMEYVAGGNFDFAAREVLFT